MRSPCESEHSISDVIELKKSNRKRLIDAIQQASPEAIDAAAQRIKEVMRRPEDLGQRRKRIAPPAFSNCD